FLCEFSHRLTMCLYCISSMVGWQGPALLGYSGISLGILGYVAVQFELQIFVWTSHTLVEFSQRLLEHARHGIDVAVIDALVKKPLHEKASDGVVQVARAVKLLGERDDMWIDSFSTALLNVRHRLPPGERLPERGSMRLRSSPTNP